MEIFRFIFVSLMVFGSHGTEDFKNMAIKNVFFDQVKKIAPPPANTILGVMSSILSLSSGSDEAMDKLQETVDRIDNKMDRVLAQLETLTFSLSQHHIESKFQTLIKYHVELSMIGSEK